MSDPSRDKARQIIRDAPTGRLLRASSEYLERFLSENPADEEIRVTDYLAAALVMLSLQQELIERLNRRIEELAAARSSGEEPSGSAESQA